MKSFYSIAGASLQTDSDIALSRSRRESATVKRHSLKCVNDCLSSDENGLTSYLACLKTCDKENQDGDEDGDEDDNVTDDGDNVDGDQDVNDDDTDVDDDNDNVDTDDGDVIYY